MKKTLTILISLIIMAGLLGFAPMQMRSATMAYANDEDPVRPKYQDWEMQDDKYPPCEPMSPAATYDEDGDTQQPYCRDWEKGKGRYSQFTDDIILLSTGDGLYPDRISLTEVDRVRTFTEPTPESLALTQAQVQAFDCSTVTDVPEVECQALVALYESTNGADWYDSANWLERPRSVIGMVLNWGKVIL